MNDICRQRHLIYNTRACARKEKGAYPLSLRPLALSAKAESLASKARFLDEPSDFVDETALPSQGGENCSPLQLPRRGSVKPAVRYATS